MLLNAFATCLLAAAAVQDPEVGERPLPRPEPLPIPRGVALRRGDRNLVVDGSVQDWPGLPPLRLDDVRQLSGSALGAFRGPGDVAARVFLLWDDDHLWVAAQVMDDWHVRLTEASQRSSEIPPADSILLSFDPARDTRAVGPDAGRQEDAEFWIAEVEGQERGLVRWDRFRGTARFALDSEAVVLRDEEKRVTTHEARIAWREILPHGQKPDARAIFDLQIVVSDFDEPTDPMPQSRVGWTFGMGSRVDPGLYGSIMLVDITADEVRGPVPMPEIPPPTEAPEPPVPGKPHWTQLLRRLHATMPSPVDAGTVDAALAGGAERLALLREIDAHHASFPRVDFLEFQQRIHRRMNRECAGIAATGLPFFWDYALEDLARRVAAPEPGYRIHRLPQGGWLVRSSAADFAIDAAGYEVDRTLVDHLDFVLCTAPLDTTKRNDQLALRMTAASPPRPFMTHISFHLPGVAADKLPLVVPERAYEPNGLHVRVLGSVDAEGLVSARVGYQVSWPDGPVIVVSGSGLLEEKVDTSRPVDLLLLSARHPNALAVAARIGARLTVLDDVLGCASVPGAAGRVTLADAHRLQEEMRPLRSIVLGPGESIAVPRD